MNQTLPVRIIALATLACAFPIGGLAAPTITEILNNSSGTPKGMPNYGIAPSSIFVVKGTGLADPGVPVLQSSAAPGLSLTLNGASLTVVVNNVTTHPALYYTSPTQIAAVLPAATPVGTGTLTVTYNGAVSAAASIVVVTSAVGINHYNQIPIPLGEFNENVDIGVATDAFTGALLSFTNSGAPGQIITPWTTGLGADPADSDTIYTLTQDTLRGGALNLFQTNATNANGARTVTNRANAGFAKISGLLAGATGRGGIISPGGCWVAPSVVGGPLAVVGLRRCGYSYGPRGTYDIDVASH